MARLSVNSAKEFASEIRATRDIWQPLANQDMAAFKASAHLCGSLSDYTHAPEVSYCGGKEGRYLVVAHTSSTGDAHLAQDGTTESGGGTSKGEIVTICEARLERSSAV